MLQLLEEPLPMLLCIRDKRSGNLQGAIVNGIVPLGKLYFLLNGDGAIEHFFCQFRIPFIWLLLLHRLQFYIYSSFMEAVPSMQIKKK